MIYSKSQHRRTKIAPVRQIDNTIKNKSNYLGFYSNEFPIMPDRSNYWLDTQKVSSMTGDGTKKSNRFEIKLKFANKSYRKETGLYLNYRGRVTCTIRCTPHDRVRQQFGSVVRPRSHHLAFHHIQLLVSPSMKSIYAVSWISQTSLGEPIIWQSSLVM